MPPPYCRAGNSGVGALSLKWAGRECCKSTGSKLQSLARQGAGVGLRGAAQNALNQIQSYAKGENMRGRLNSEDAQVSTIQVDLAIYVSRSEDSDFHAAPSPGEREPAQSTKSRLERWKQHECQLPREFGVMRHAIGLELSMGRRMS